MHEVDRMLQKTVGSIVSSDLQGITCITGSDGNVTVNQRIGILRQSWLNGN